jgi:hypothetical protein
METHRSDAHQDPRLGGSAKASDRERDRIAPVVELGGRSNTVSKFWVRESGSVFCGGCRLMDAAVVHSDFVATMKAKYGVDVLLYINPFLVDVRYAMDGWCESP